jgi:pimeloyl-ACP methyl ester carboxylesterase
MSTTTGCERTVKARGLKLFVREQGDGHPLLMINGIGANIEMWGPAEGILGRGSRTIAFDCPGTGRSQTPLFPMPMRELARTVVAMLDELGHEQVDVMGYSFGGVLAQQLAHDAPERVRRLALVSTGCGWGSRLGPPSAITAVTSPLRYYSRSWYELTNKLLGETESEAGDVLARLAYPPTPLGYAYQLWAAASWSSRLWLHRVEAPTLVLSGGRDRLVPPANAVQLARLLPTSRLHLFPEAAHLLLFYRGGAAPRLLGDFFASESLARSTAWTAGLVPEPAAADAFSRAA